MKESDLGKKVNATMEKCQPHGCKIMSSPRVKFCVEGISDQLTTDETSLTKDDPLISEEEFQLNGSSIFPLEVNNQR